jgi:hypothetical protein
MTQRKKRWLYVAGGVTVVTIAGLAIAASVLSRRFEPFIREQAVAYMSERFNCDVELAALRIRMPKLSPINVLLTRGKGASARVEGEGIAMRYKGVPSDTPPLFRIRQFSFQSFVSRAFRFVRDKLPRFDGEFKTGGNFGAPFYERFDLRRLVKSVLHFDRRERLCVFFFSSRKAARSDFYFRRHYK